MFVAIISVNYPTSFWCENELRLAMEQGKLVIPIYHSGTYPPENLEMRLGESP